MRARRALVVAALALVAGQAAPGDAQSERETADTMKRSFASRGQATLDRLEQDEAQAVCSRLPREGTLPRALAERIERASLATVRYPAAGALMGDWREGEKIAQSGVGKQFSDDPAKPSGGNCYACHQLSPAELSYGTIGPSLLGFGKQRGASGEMQRYTYAKIYNAQAFHACSTMPRFGDKGILTEAQIAHLVALLLDPASPLNR